MEDKIKILKYIHNFECRGHKTYKCHSINDDIDDLILHEKLYRQQEEDIKLCRQQEEHKQVMNHVNKNISNGELSLTKKLLLLLMPVELHSENENQIVDDIIKMGLYGIKMILSNIDT